MFYDFGAMVHIAPVPFIFKPSPSKYIAAFMLMKEGKASFVHIVVVDVFVCRNVHNLWKLMNGG